MLQSHLDNLIEDGAGSDDQLRILSKRMEVKWICELAYCNGSTEMKEAAFELDVQRARATGGDDLQFFLTKFGEAGFVVKWDLVNPIDWGFPEDRDRIFFIALRADIATSVEFHKYTVLQTPMVAPTRYRSIDDILDGRDCDGRHDDDAIWFDANDPNIRWDKNPDLIRAHRREQPAKRISLGFVNNARDRATGNQIISSRGATGVATGSHLASGVGGNQALVYIHPRQHPRTLRARGWLRIRGVPNFHLQPPIAMHSACAHTTLRAIVCFIVHSLRIMSFI